MRPAPRCSPRSHAKSPLPPSPARLTPSMNPRLRLAIQSARAENMPKDNIERAIKKAQGGDSEAYEAIRYEGYAPGGVAIIAEALTDNRNRTGGAVRAAFTKNGGNLAATGAVATCSSTSARSASRPPPALQTPIMEAAIEAGADDATSDANGHVVVCSFDSLGTVAAALEEKLGEPESVRAIWKPNLTSEVDEDNAQSILKLISALEDDDDVQNVFANFEVSEDVLKKLTAA